MDERLEEILTRLDALERRLGPAPEAPSATCGFQAEERRIVDLIVRLTTENVVRAMEERLRRMPSGPPPPPPPPDWGRPPRGPHGHGR